MNKKQKILLWIGIAVILLIGLFPPWNYVCVKYSVVDIAPRFHYIKDAGYHFLWNPPSYLISDLPLEERETTPKFINHLRIEGLPIYEICLNTRRLLAEYMIALPVLGLLFTFAFGDKHHMQKNPQKTTSQKSPQCLFEGDRKAPAGSGFQTSKEFLSYLLRGLSKR